jgi:hypothetical protein
MSRRSILNYLKSIMGGGSYPSEQSVPTPEVTPKLQMYLEPLEYQGLNSYMPLTPHREVSEYTNGGYAPSINIEGYDNFNDFYNDYLEGILRGWSYRMPNESPLRLELLKERPPADTILGDPLPLNRLLIR